MLETQNSQRQLWIVQRLQRICTSFRRNVSFEPCLEQYEQHVATVMDTEITPAASAWITLIVQCLRQDEKFVPEHYLQ